MAPELKKKRRSMEQASGCESCENYKMKLVTARDGSAHDVKVNSFEPGFADAVLKPPELGRFILAFFTVNFGRK